ncbi:cohesin domain-containing protein [Methanolobus sp. WCC1]|uniref:cohesin domain-containing protein n=1 Tax=Methanolobus sp. WCC1 TaxID=3125782 RepID=UPI0032435629
MLIVPDTGIAGLQFDIEFDSSKIQVNKVSKGDFLDSNGDPTFTNYGNIDNTAGILSDIYGVVLGPVSILESGSFARITMTAKEQATSTSTISLKNVIISDSSGHPVEVFIKDTTLTIKVPSDKQDKSWWDEWNDLWQDDWRHFW